MDIEGESSNQKINSAANLPWVEKYRPKRIDEICHQVAIVKTLKSSIEQGNLPHLLLYGPPGTGKTSIILALAHELFGPDTRDRVLELNASDERGIDVIRQKVVTFAQQSVKKSSPGYPSPPYKIIIMDEADSLTMDAQSALRRILELYSKVTRFCFICNYVSKIMPALSSRCARYELSALPQSCVMERLKFISGEEKMSMQDTAIQYIFEHSQGDLRASIHMLQNANLIYKNQTITAQMMQKISIDVPLSIANTLVDVIKGTTQTNSICSLVARVESIIQDGLPANLVIRKLSDVIINNSVYSDQVKADVSIAIAKADKSSVDGCNEELVLLNACCAIAKALDNKA